MSRVAQAEQWFSKAQVVLEEDSVYTKRLIKDFFGRDVPDGFTVVRIGKRIVKGSLKIELVPHIEGWSWEWRPVDQADIGKRLRDHGSLFVKPKGGAKKCLMLRPEEDL